MKSRLLIGPAVAASIVGGSAFGADLPYKAPPLVEPVFTWTGFYVGAQIGGAWAKSDWTYQNINPYDSLGPAGPITGSANSFSMSALAGGVQFGFNYQINRLVLGVEGSWTATGLSQTNPNVVQVFAPFSTQTVKTEITDYATVTGRFGVLVDPTWLVYGKGGYAVANIETSGTTTPAVQGLNLNWNTKQWHNGWIGGGGVEHRLWKNVTLGVEYNYIQLDSAIHTGAVSGGIIGPANQIVHSVNGNIQTIMARLNILIR